MKPDDIRQAVTAAHKRIAPLVLETPLRRSDYLSRLVNAEVLCKLENVQITGSFKARGAASSLSLLSAAERQRGVVTASSGNHGAAVAAMLSRLGGRGIVYVPTNAPRVKVEAIRAYGVEVRFHSEDSGECEVAALDYAKSSRLTYVSPYDDPDVIAGQGTIGAEIERQTGAVDHLFVSVGGGGLTSGIAGYLKAGNPKLRVWGVSPLNDHSMRLSAAAGHAVPHFEASITLSDGTAGTVQPGAITIPLCRALVDDWPLVSEDEIASAMRAYIGHENQLIEGAAGVAIAGLINAAAREPETFRSTKIALIICGGRIDPEKLITVLKGEAP